MLSRPEDRPGSKAFTLLVGRALITNFDALNALHGYQVRLVNRPRQFQMYAGFRCGGRALSWSDTIQAVVIREASIPAKTLQRAA